MHHYALPEDFFNGLISSMAAAGHPRSRCCCPARVNAACNLLRKSVDTELLINPCDQIRAAHTAAMARHLSSFSGPAISRAGTTAGFGAALEQLPGNACTLRSGHPAISRQLTPMCTNNSEDCPITATPDGDPETCAACQNLLKQSQEAALSQGTRKAGAFPAARRCPVPQLR